METPGSEGACPAPRDFDMTKMAEVIRFLESHDWKVVASTDPYGNQRTTFARFQCSRCRAEVVSLATGSPAQSAQEAPGSPRRKEETPQP